MGKEEKNRTNNDEEIDLGVVFGKIREFFRLLLKTGFSVLDFYYNKKILFALLTVGGLILGFLVDKYWISDYEYTQEIIIQPKYESTQYIYDQVEYVKRNIKNEDFQKVIGIKKEQAQYFDELNVEPLYSYNDLLDYLKEYQKEYLMDHFEGFDRNKLYEEKYFTFHKFHKLKISFSSFSSNNNEVTSAILRFLKNNKFFEKQIQVNVEESKRNLESNKKSLKFIEEYLIKLSEQPKVSSKDYVVLTEEENLPTIASLLKQKEFILNKINRYERVLVLETELFGELHKGKILKNKKGLLKRFIFIIPFILIMFCSLFYLINFINKQIKKIF